MEVARANDLTSKMSPFLDVHMISPLLDFVRESELYDSKAVARQKIKIFSKTNMIELVSDEIKIVADEADIKNDSTLAGAFLAQRTDAIFDKIDHVTEPVAACEAFFDNTALIADLKADANLTLDFVSSSHGISIGMLEEYYRFAKFKYDCGMYLDAEIMLGRFLSISQTQTPSVLGALWGRLACRILQAKWDESLGDLLAVKDAIESRSLTPVDQLRQRAWLMHWGLLVFLNQRNGADALFDFYSEKSYLQAMENLCPWLIRYYTVAAIMSTKRRVIIREAVNEIQAVAYLHSDPVTRLVESIYERFDFAEAQAHLVDSIAMLKADFFLFSFADKFLHEARLVICEVYCGINRRVDIVTLAGVLQLSDEDTEKWIVEMIRGAAVSNSSGEASSMSSALPVDVRIDSDGKQVFMAPAVKSPHQRVVDKTRDLPTRCGILTSNIETLVTEQGSFLKELALARSAPA